MTSSTGRIDSPLVITPTWQVPSADLRWQFSRSSGPGGQGVNTADSRVELVYAPARSAAFAALPSEVRDRALERLAGRLVNGEIVIAASEFRSQLRNRTAARERLIHLLRSAVAAPPPARRATRPGRGAVERRLTAKKLRSSVKAGRGRPPVD